MYTCAHTFTIFQKALTLVVVQCTINFYSAQLQLTQDKLHREQDRARSLEGTPVKFYAFICINIVNECTDSVRIELS